jgi:hypothetical protein
VPPDFPEGNSGCRLDGRRNTICGLTQRWRCFKIFLSGK